jgi:uncharacterized membrane protein
MNRKTIISFYKIIGGVCCTIIGGLIGFIFFHFLGASLGACMGFTLGKMLDKNVLGDIA